MADINKFYDGVVEYFDPHGDSGIPNPSTINFFGFGGSNFWLNEMPFWPELDKINKQSAATRDAVRVGYSGTTVNDRKGWLEQRISAIDNRATFIRNRTTDLLKELRSSGSDSYVAIEKLVTSALSVVPAVGPVVSYVESGAQAARTLDAYKLQALLQDYAKDLNQLAGIRQELITEYQTIPTDTVPKKTLQPGDPGYQAPVVIPTWVYYGGAVLLLLLFVYLYRRNHKRRKR